MRHKNPAIRQAEYELEAVLEEAIRTADRHEPRASIARRAFDVRPDLMKQLMKPWTLERIEHILERLERRSFTASQLTIPGITLPPVIKLVQTDPTGQKRPEPVRIALLDMTLPQLRSYRKVLQQQKDKRITQLDKVIAFMRQHAPYSRKVKLRELVERYGQKELNFAGL